MIPILPLLSVMNLSNHLQQSSNDSEQQNKKQFLAKLKYKAMLVKLKASYGGMEFREQLINLSMIKEIRPGWSENQGLDKDKWCEVHFIDGSSVYVESTLNDILYSEKDREEINVVTRQYRTGGGPY